MISSKEYSWPSGSLTVSVIVEVTMTLSFNIASGVEMKQIH